MTNLRKTGSFGVFLSQLGRGIRRADYAKQSRCLQLGEGDAENLLPLTRLVLCTIHPLPYGEKNTSHGLLLISEVIHEY